MKPISSTYAKYVDVNAHLHTPYSFSAFEKLTDALDQAVQENVKVVGINDFNTTKGYQEWSEEAHKRNLYPLFNIELICLDEKEQAEGVRFNDPKNPGRMYVSGKGLCYPTNLPEPYASQLNNICTESNIQSENMCRKLDDFLKSYSAGFSISYTEIKDTLTKGLVRERHIAKALRIKALEHYKTREALKLFLEQILQGKLVADIQNDAAIENDIRNVLLKAGGKAYIPETSKAFLPLKAMQEIILAAKGIPTYPFIADDIKGEFSDFERDIEKVACQLRQKGFYSVEFITTRNSIQVLEKYAGYLHQNGFIVTLGSEHNTPVSEPMKLSARGGIPLSDSLKQINYEGACVIAAHQERVRRGEKGYLNAKGAADIIHRDEYVQQGNEIIQKTINPN